MYQEACKLEPDNLIYRQALRDVERRKFNNEPAKVGRLVGARTQPIRMTARSAKSKGNWAEALEDLRGGVRPQPLGRRHAPGTPPRRPRGWASRWLAQWLLESVATRPPTTPTSSATWPTSTRSTHALAKAIPCWERVKKLNPNDEDANRQINALSASATIQRSGLGEASPSKRRRRQVRPRGRRRRASRS